MRKSFENETIAWTVLNFMTFSNSTSLACSVYQDPVMPSMLKRSSLVPTFANFVQLGLIFCAISHVLRLLFCVGE